MNTIRKTVCILLAIGIILSVSVTSSDSLGVDSFLTCALPSNADILDKIIYLEGQLRSLRDNSYSVYWNGNSQNMEDALYVMTNDCEYLSNIAEDLYDEVHSLIYK
jgi:hypothetical protein